MFASSLDLKLHRVWLSTSTSRLPHLINPSITFDKLIQLFHAYAVISAKEICAILQFRLEDCDSVCDCIHKTGAEIVMLPTVIQWCNR
jgi:hypothetical protein